MFFIAMLLFSFSCQASLNLLLGDADTKEIEIKAFISSSVGYDIEGAAGCWIGTNRSHQEDRVHVVNCSDSGAFATGVFDGHGGQQTVRLLTGTSLLKNIFSYLNEPISSIFQRKNRALLQINIKNNDVSGSTAAVSVIHNNTLTIAHCGDSRAIVFNGQGKVVYETRDHNPIHEIDRLDKGFSSTLGDWYKNKKSRIYNRLNGCAVSRSFGDRDIQEYGLIVDPEVQEVNLTQHEEIFVLQFSDGITDCLIQDKKENYDDQEIENMQDITEQAQARSAKELAADSAFNQQLVKVIVNQINAGKSLDEIVNFFMQHMGRVTSLDSLGINQEVNKPISRDNVSFVLYKISKKMIEHELGNTVNNTNGKKEFYNNGNLFSYKNIIVIGGIFLCVLIFKLYRSYAK